MTETTLHPSLNLNLHAQMWDIVQSQTALCTVGHKKKWHSEIIRGKGWVSVSSYTQRWGRRGKARVNKYQLQDSRKSFTGHSSRA